MADANEVIQESEGSSGSNRLLRRRNLIRSAQDKLEKGKLTFMF